MTGSTYPATDARGATYDPAPHWGWLVAIGVVTLILGVVALANIVASTVATVWIVGALMIVAGVAQIIGAFRTKGWGRTLLWIAAGILYIVAGLVAFADPLLASAVLTLVLAFSLIFSGVARVTFGFGVKPARGWGWVVAGGIVTLLAGILIALGWPGTLWVLGVILAVDLIVQGTSYTVLGLALRR